MHFGYRLNYDVYELRDGLQYNFRPLADMRVISLWDIGARLFGPELRSHISARLALNKIGAAVDLRATPLGLERLTNLRVVQSLRGLHQSMQTVWDTLNSEPS